MVKISLIGQINHLRIPLLYLRWTALFAAYLLFIIFLFTTFGDPGSLEQELGWSIVGRIPLLLVVLLAWTRRKTNERAYRTISWQAWLLFLLACIPLGQLLLAKRAVYEAAAPATLLLFTASVMVTACLEELIFRGLLFLGQIRATKWVAALGCSSLSFALAHGINYFIYSASLGGLLSQIGFALLVGAYLALLVGYAQRLWMAVVLHAAINFTLATARLEEPVFPPDFTLSPLAVGVMLGLSVLALLGFRQVSSAAVTNQATEAEERITDADY